MSMTRFRIEPERSWARIDMRTNVHPAHVETNGLEGFIDADLAGGRIDLATAAARLELAVERLHSDNPLFEREMHKRINARRYPRIVGELRTMRELGPAGSYELEGDLSFHGVTRSVRGEMKLLVPDDDTIDLEGEETFDIRDFNIEPPKLLLLKAYPEMKVRVRLAARRQA
jgi:polyisoprenoid-binding protein YceI